MIEPVTAPPEDGLDTEITEALVAIWTRYSGSPPLTARTEIHDNVVTCVLVDAVGDYNAGLAAPRSDAGADAAGQQTSAGYRSEAAAAVADLTGRRVRAFISSHDADTDAATETFTLERRFLA
jgi:hypothetical protein